MDAISYRWRDGPREHEYHLIHVEGTHGRPYSFGEPPARRPIEIGDFFIGSVPVTQALWANVMGADANPAIRKAPDLPVENVSWQDLTRPGGFLERINASPLAAMLHARVGSATSLRLPSETEWEYAARGGPHWRNGFRYSGSDDIKAVAWYDRRHGDHTQPVAGKAPNELGIHDMSGNVWEWCQDVFTRDTRAIPRDGMPFTGAGDERVLRGGCFHNWAEHCTVSKRYEIASDFHDGCIGVRLVAAAWMSPSRVA